VAIVVSATSIDPRFTEAGLGLLNQRRSEQSSKGGLHDQKRIIS